ncbi:alkaline phosphatase family protein [Undibacterium sp. Di26W]|uniref:alkaline phosphatase family protein n=1 Tax=Undibacterium sp. Di26W TaxID=3413035 RepID=UPI003BF161B9
MIVDETRQKGEWNMQQNATNETPGLANIKRVVVMMFENRSFDHIFGALPGVNGLFEDGQINQNYFNLADPLNPPSPANLPVYPMPIDPSLPQLHDFNHDFGDGMMPSLFGPTFTVSGGTGQPNDSNTTYTSGYVNGVPIAQVQPVPQTYPVTNSGFYSTYRYYNNEPTIQGQAALTYFEAGKLQVLHTLANNFVLCDNWHCDMPGHTLPNRTFIHTGRTGVGIDDTDNGDNRHASIFDLIEPLPDCPPPGYQPSKWNIYVPVDEGGTLGQCDTVFLNSNVKPYQGAPITDFATDCKNGTLPFYSFIMCWHPSSDAYTDTSMHPNALIQPGENLLAAVYNTLRSSPCWEDTLLVVTFDENGGMYDHVFPPSATPPVPGAAPDQQYLVGDCGNAWALNSTFDFSLLGVRVPALLISPWLAAGIDSNQYQNTSVLRFLIDRMNAVDAPTTPIPPLTERDATAPSLDSAFVQYGQITMRQDCPDWIVPYATLPCTDPSTGSNAIPYSDGTLTPWTPPKSMMRAKPVAYIQEFLNIYVAPLPGHPDSGKKIIRDFATNGDVASYTQERTQAAKQFYQAHSPSASA